MRPVGRLAAWVLLALLTGYLFSRAGDAAVAHAHWRGAGAAWDVARVAAAGAGFLLLFTPRRSVYAYDEVLQFHRSWPLGRFVAWVVLAVVIGYSSTAVAGALITHTRWREAPTMWTLTRMMVTGAGLVLLFTPRRRRAATT